MECFLFFDIIHQAFRENSRSVFGGYLVSMNEFPSYRKKKGKKRRDLRPTL
jgi:hypothetical protein